MIAGVKIAGHKTENKHFKGKHIHVNVRTRVHTHAPRFKIFPLEETQSSRIIHT